MSGYGRARDVGIVPCPSRGVLGAGSCADPRLSVRDFGLVEQASFSSSRFWSSLLDLVSLDRGHIERSGMCIYLVKC